MACFIISCCLYAGIKPFLSMFAKYLVAFKIGAQAFPELKLAYCLAEILVKDSCVTWGKDEALKNLFLFKKSGKA